MKSHCLLTLAGLALVTRLVATESPAPVTDKYKYDKALQAELLAILADDQAPRVKLEAIAREKGYDSPEVGALQDAMLDNDAVNIGKVETILEEHGWVGPELVGPKAGDAIFMVLQHADISYQQKYLPLVRQVTRDGKIKTRDLAMFEDRVALREGRPQTYGTQLRAENGGKLHVSTMIDPDHVDERRAAIGLPPMAEYVKNWNLTWDVETYKREVIGHEVLVPESPMPKRVHSNIGQPDTK